MPKRIKTWKKIVSRFTKKTRVIGSMKGEPILLIGGSVEDNLFQIPNLKEHLELLKSVGGNYVRSTMSWVDEGDVPPLQKSR